MTAPQRFFMVLSILCGCSPVRDLTSLPGEYLAEPNGCKSQLKIEGNHRFTQNITCADENRVYNTSGTWEFDQASARLKLSAVRIITDGDGKLIFPPTPPQSAHWFAYKRLLTGRVILESDEHHPYSKR